MPSETPLLPGLALAAFLLLMAAAVATDLRARRIPNLLPVLLLLLFVPVAALLPEARQWLSRLLAAALILLPGLAVWRAGALGAGDVKLLTAAAWWTGLGLLVELLLRVALAGGALALVMLALQGARRPAGSPPGRRRDADATVPYGVAIALAAASLLPEIPPFIRLCDQMALPVLPGAGSP